MASKAARVQKLEENQNLIDNFVEVKHIYIDGGIATTKEGSVLEEDNQGNWCHKDTGEHHYTKGLYKGNRVSLIIKTFIDVVEKV